MNAGSLWVLGGVYAVLGLASSVVWTLGRQRPDADFSELRLRIHSWWTIVVVCTLALILDRTVAIGFFAVVSLLALREYLGLIPLRGIDRRLLLCAYLAVPLQYCWIAIEWYGMFIIFIPVYLFLLLPVGLILTGMTRGYLAAAGSLQWGLMCTVFSLGHLAYLLVLPDGRYSGVDGAGLVLYLIVLTQLNDVAQYCWGKLLGRHRIAPVVSPNKTLEGFVGGLLTTATLAVVLAPLLTPFAWLAALGFGLLVGLAGFFGDLGISALKRDLGIKDSGTLLPGHGGILDRVDSLTYTAPLFFHVTRYFYF